MGERAVRTFFDRLRSEPPAVGFVDHFERLFVTPSSSWIIAETPRRVKTEFLCQLDGVGQSARPWVLASTTQPWDMDVAVRRRTSELFALVVPPDLDARRRHLRARLGSSAISEEALDSLVQRTQDYTYDDLEDIIGRAMIDPAQPDFQAALAHVTPSAGPEVTQR